MAGPVRMTRRALLPAAALVPALASGARTDADRGYDPAAESYAARLAQLGARARDFRATMVLASASLRPGHLLDLPAASPTATAACRP